MKLTGKCKQDFLEYYWETKIKPLNFPVCKKQDLEAFFDTISELFQNALIIEFFDSVGVVIEVAEDEGWDAYVDKEWVKTSLNTRQEATNAAIAKANELYNSKNK